MEKCKDCKYSVSGLYELQCNNCIHGKATDNFEPKQKTDRSRRREPIGNGNPAINSRLDHIQVFLTIFPIETGKREIEGFRETQAAGEMRRGYFDRLGSSEN